MTKRLFFFLLLSACNSPEKNLSENEKSYNSVSDSLDKYRSEIITSTGKIQTSISDYMKLDYASYKSKHKLSDKEMINLAQTFTISYEIARTIKEINENMDKINTTKDLD